MTQPIRIGFAYDEPDDSQGPGQVESVEAEYEDARTLSWLRATLQELGPVTDLPWGRDIVARLANADLDVILNITEAIGGRNRESLIPALAEALGIPCTGSDTLGLGISLDKYLTKVVAGRAGVPTPGYLLVEHIAQWEALAPAMEGLRFPVIAKPNHGGSSLGIRRRSKAGSLSELREVVAWVLDNFEDSVLVEEFVFGREFTVGLLERADASRPEPQLQLLPVAEIRVGDGAPGDFYSYEMKSIHRKELICPADLPAEAVERMAEYARRTFRALGCRDLARVDFRVDGDGTPYLLEINPLPGLSPYYSSFPAQARAAGISPREVVYRIVRNALARHIQF